MIDDTIERNRALGQIEKQYHIDRLRYLRKNWETQNKSTVRDSRIREIEFKLTLLHQTPPENFLDLDALTVTINSAWNNVVQKEKSSQ